jgi:hypothetical protein
MRYELRKLLEMDAKAEVRPRIPGRRITLCGAGRITVLPWKQSDEADMLAKVELLGGGVWQPSGGYKKSAPRRSAFP